MSDRSDSERTLAQEPSPFGQLKRSSISHGSSSSSGGMAIESNSNEGSSRSAMQNITAQAEQNQNVTSTSNIQGKLSYSIEDVQTSKVGSTFDNGGVVQPVDVDNLKSTAALTSMRRNNLAAQKLQQMKQVQSNSLLASVLSSSGIPSASALSTNSKSSTSFKGGKDSVSGLTTQLRSGISVPNSSIVSSGSSLSAPSNNQNMSAASRTALIVDGLDVNAEPMPSADVNSDVESLGKFLAVLGTNSACSGAASIAAGGPTSSSSSSTASNPDWTQQVKMLMIVRRLAQFHTNALLPFVQTLLKPILQAAVSERSAVQRLAVNALADIFSQPSLGKPLLRARLDGPCRILIFASARTANTFLQRAADSALTALCELATVRLLDTLCSLHGHASKAVRQTSISAAVLCISKASQPLLNSHFSSNAAGVKLLSTCINCAAVLSSDGSVRTRELARRLAQLLETTAPQAALSAAAHSLPFRAAEAYKAVVASLPSIDPSSQEADSHPPRKSRSSQGRGSRTSSSSLEGSSQDIQGSQGRNSQDYSSYMSATSTENEFFAKSSPSPVLEENKTKHEEECTSKTKCELQPTQIVEPDFVLPEPRNHRRISSVMLPVTESRRFSLLFDPEAEREAEALATPCKKSSPRVAIIEGCEGTECGEEGQIIDVETHAKERQEVPTAGVSSASCKEAESASDKSSESSESNPWSAEEEDAAELEATFRADVAAVLSPDDASCTLSRDVEDSDTSSCNQSKLPSATEVEGDPTDPQVCTTTEATTIKATFPSIASEHFGFTLTTADANGLSQPSLLPQSAQHNQHANVNKSRLVTQPAPLSRFGSFKVLPTQSSSPQGIQANSCALIALQTNPQVASSLLWNMGSGSSNVKSTPASASETPIPLERSTSSPSPARIPEVSAKSEFRPPTLAVEGVSVSTGRGQMNQQGSQAAIWNLDIPVTKSLSRPISSGKSVDPFGAAFPNYQPDLAPKRIEAGKESVIEVPKSNIEIPTIEVKPDVVLSRNETQRIESVEANIEGEETVASLKKEVKEAVPSESEVTSSTGSDLLGQMTQRLKQARSARSFISVSGFSSVFAQAAGALGSQSSDLALSASSSSLPSSSTSKGNEGSIQIPEIAPIQVIREVSETSSTAKASAPSVPSSQQAPTIHVAKLSQTTRVTTPIASRREISQPPNSASSTCRRILGTPVSTPIPFNASNNALNSISVGDIAMNLSSYPLFFSGAGNTSTDAQGEIEGLSLPEMPNIPIEFFSTSEAIDALQSLRVFIYSCIDTLNKASSIGERLSQDAPHVALRSKLQQRMFSAQTLALVTEAANHATKVNLWLQTSLNTLQQEQENGLSFLSQGMANLLLSKR